MVGLRRLGPAVALGGLLLWVLMTFTLCRPDDGTDLAASVTPVSSLTTAGPTTPARSARVSRYEVVRLEQAGPPTRPRYKTDIIAPADFGDEQVIPALVDAAMRTFADRGDARAVVVFAYSGPAAAERGVFDRGRAYASSDRLGWAGDGLFSMATARPRARDEGKVYITLGGPTGRQREAVAERDGSWTALASGTPPPVPSAAPPQPPEPPTAVPAQSPAPSTPSVAPAAAVSLVVVEVGSQGVSIRTEPSTGARIRAWPEGTAVAWLGEEQEAAGRSWKKVRDPDGNIGWIAADYLAEGP
jgi:hypothetical protein